MMINIKHVYHKFYSFVTRQLGRQITARTPEKMFRGEKPYIRKWPDFLFRAVSFVEFKYLRKWL